MFHIIDFEGLNVYNGELGVMNAICNIFANHSETFSLAVTVAEGISSKYKAER